MTHADVAQLSWSELEQLVATGEVDTVVVAFTDMQGRLAILHRQLNRLGEQGLVAEVATELEFIVFDQPYRQAWASGYRGLTPASDYNLDYTIAASSRMEPLLRDIRLGMQGAGLRVESVKGECNKGQQEIGFRYDEALVTCDNLAVYKNGAKEIADLHGKSLTFMAKYDEREGNSCHIHFSLRGADGSAVLTDSAGPHGMSPLFRSFIAGQLATIRELTLFLAPNINSYKRFADTSFAPTAVAWGLPCTGNAYQQAGFERLPATLAEAAVAFETSALAREPFGDDVVEHYVNNARVEQAAFDAAVTDWERMRGFERF